ncbi:alpha/beta hydrolase [Achromobacter seleniivolatilans]|uniref:Alpha/beta hydrolase n=1 Tax=Achromobacter seleniivolatilans TaxID=3047478 RepID=A0ABY9M5V3_9BURK|nr:alpha/beta hydrolase [Achromobacter sp. R39]WMD22387.1 alpha/beta hydrolase [Achromobacter sp. R39]
MNTLINADAFTLDGVTFQHRRVRVDGLGYHVVVGGSGPPLILLAGFPQSWYAWRRVMPLLAPYFRVFAVDLPGQGDSDKPLDGYDTRTTGERLRALFHTLGLTRYALAGHDIGAWVGYPYAARYPGEVERLVLLDANIPGVTLKPSIELGPDNWKSWHFLFNSVPDLPEALLAGRERILIEWFFSRKTANKPGVFSRADIDEYERVYQTLGGLRGMLGYYRAANEDAAQNRELRDKPLTLPVLALGGDQGSAPDLHQALKPLALNLQGGVLQDCGHYLPEEQPRELARRMLAFLTEKHPA